MTPVYRQSDSRWANKLVGFGVGKFQTFRYVGCVICGITYILNSTFGYNLTPAQVNDKIKAVNGFVGASVYWSRVPLAFPELKWYWRNYNYNWILNAAIRIWILIKPKVPVLAEVYEPSSVTKKHWITLIGGGKCYDSITGMIRATSTWKNYTGAARYDRS